jgi:hypothetical protein
MKNQKVIIGIAGVILILAVGYFLIFNKSTKEPVVAEPQVAEEETVLKLPAEDIGLALTAIENNRKVLIEIANTSGLVSVEYELSYTSKGDIPRGVLGTIDIKSKNKPIEHEIVLGTCSDVCHYDQDVSNIKVILKVTKSDNKVYQSEKTLD